MNSLHVGELVRMTSIWSLNKANHPPDTWNFYQCVHESRKHAYCNYLWEKCTFLECQIFAFLITLTSSTVLRPYSSTDSNQDQMTQFSKDRI